MTNIAKRIAALPRARKGKSTVLLVPEHELVDLLLAARRAEAAFHFGADRPATDTEINTVHSGWSPAPLNKQVPGHLNLAPPRGQHISVVAREIHDRAQASDARRSRSW